MGPIASASVRAVVVCVDDDPAILRSYRRLLRDEPYELRMFEDPGLALAWIEQARVDVVLSDERMPAMTGTAFLAEVGRRWPRTGRALVTATPALHGRFRTIAKPWDNRDLKGAIRDLLERREFLGP